MILLDSDVMIDLLRQYPPAAEWFDTLEDEEEIILPGYVVMVADHATLRERQRVITLLVGRELGQFWQKQKAALTTACTRLG